ncbi:acetylajmalan esterase-like [Apium graveolens]|uniref:acetylajmalan esterase-like n=1 Tax=Apium graveolens TaxID=4045 RepID=UPI003D7B1D05
MYQFGDSISDTGNKIVEDPFTQCGRPPFGESFSLGPSGRCSNGFLMIDYIALGAGIPLLKPYLGVDKDFSNGVDFAVSGSATLSAIMLSKRNIIQKSTNSSFGKQVDRLITHLTTICNSKIATREYLKDALFIIGEMGGNDYNYAFLQGTNPDEIHEMVPEVVQSIIDLGGAKIIVQGSFPFGCYPVSVTTYQSSNTTTSDKYQCVELMNRFAVFHNEHLQNAITTLQDEYPHIVILYGDYYNAYQWLLENAAYFGITSTLRVCCGTGGILNYNNERRCGDPGVLSCQDSDTHLSWDGIHMSQKANHLITQWIVADLFPKLKCDHLQISNYQYKHNYGPCTDEDVDFL